MNKHIKPTSDRDSDCTVDACDSGLRNRYFKRKSMRARDFKIEQDYFNDRRRLLSRAIHGWGVAYGFKLEVVANGGGTRQFSCGTGLALDRHGRELLRPAAGIVPGSQIKLLAGLLELAEQRKQPNADLNKTERCLLQIHYAERKVGQLRFGTDCDCEDDEWNHVCEDIVFSLKVRRDQNEPGKPCPKCGCSNDAQQPSTERDRGPHHCLCEWLTNNEVPSKAGLPCHWEGFDLDLDDGIALAWVTVAFDKCGHPVFQSIDDPCTPRPLVKTNDLLFDLIRGCDLTRIKDVSWSPWHRKVEPIDWPAFQGKFPPSGATHAEVETGFSITFSAPVQVATLTRECVAMTCFVRERRSGWLEPNRVPIIEIKDEPPEEGDPPNTTRKATLVVTREWCKDEIWEGPSLLDAYEARVEIEIRGDLILDCHGQAVDANAVGLNAAPSGNGSPGGTYLSAFRLKPKG